MNRSLPIAIPASRHDVLVATLQVWRAGFRAAGLDQSSFSSVFGHGPGSAEFIRTVSRLCHYRHAYRFSPARVVRVVDGLPGKVRELQIPSFHDRIILKVLANKLAILLPRTRVDWCRPDMDARASVVALAREVRRHPTPLTPILSPRICGDDVTMDMLATRLAAAPKGTAWVGLRIDLANAFGSMNWKAVLNSPAATKYLPEDVRMGLAQVYAYYSPTGTGVALGLATSPAMLQLAMVEADEYLLSCKVAVWRYMDDVAASVPRLSRAGKILEGFSARVAPYGLSISARKSGAFVTSIPWLGHTIDMADGTVDIADQTKIKFEVLVRAVDEHELGKLAQVLDHFALAARGDKFRDVLRQVEERWGDKLDLSKFDIKIVDHLEREPVLPAGEIRRNNPNPTSGTTTRSCTGTTQYGIPDRQCTRDGCHNHRAASEHHESPAGSVTETEPMEERPSRRHHRGDRREGHRRVHDLAQLLGGFTHLLRLADELAFAIAKRNTELEAEVLFGSYAKAQQYARASQLWDQVLAVLARRPFLLTPREREVMLAETMPVLLAAATLTVIDSSWFCRHDPLEVLLQKVKGTKSVAACKADLVEERRARENGERPTRKSMFAHVLMGDDDRPPVVRAGDWVRNVFRADGRNQVARGGR